MQSCSGARSLALSPKLPLVPYIACTQKKYYLVIQATPAMSTSRISILSLMSKWFFIPNIFSLYVFAFQLRLCRKRLTWSNGYLEVIFHALDVFSITFATACVEVKNQPSQGRRIVFFGYVYALPEVRTSSKQWSKTIKVLKFLSIEQLILYLAQLNSFTVLTWNHTQYR